MPAPDDAMWAAMEAAAGTEQRIDISVPRHDPDAPHARDDFGPCRVIRYDRRPRSGTVTEIATVQPADGDHVRIVHRVVRVGHS